MPEELWAVLAPSGVTATFGSEGEARGPVASFDAGIRERLEVMRYSRAPEQAAELNSFTRLASK